MDKDDFYCEPDALWESFVKDKKSRLDAAERIVLELYEKGVPRISIESVIHWLKIEHARASGQMLSFSKVSARLARYLIEKHPQLKSALKLNALRS